MKTRRLIEVSPWALIGMAAMLMLLPLRWVVGAAIAGLFHELCHFLAIRLCGGEVTDFLIGAGGAKMRITAMSPIKEMLCAAAGPIGSFALLMLAGYAPAAALCGFAQGIFNLLPVYPLDGGRILRCILEMAYPRVSYSLIHGTELVMKCFSLCAMISLLFALDLLIWIPLLLLKLLPEKNPLQRCRTKGTI